MFSWEGAEFKNCEVFLGGVLVVKVVVVVISESFLTCSLRPSFFIIGSLSVCFFKF